MFQAQDLADSVTASPGAALKASIAPATDVVVILADGTRLPVVKVVLTKGSETEYPGGQPPVAPELQLHTS